MKKTLLLAFAFLSLWATPAHATAHYFHNGSADNNLPCTIGDPCDNFKGTTLDNAGALSCGDTINLKRGDVWEGSEAEIEVNTVGCAGNPIIVQAYGSGANPILAGSPATTVGWVNTSGAIWSLASQSQAHLYTVTQDDNKGLLECAECTTTNLPAGSYKLSGTTLYVRLWDDTAPASHNVRVGNFAHFLSDGARGLLRDTDTVTRAHYHSFRDITIIGANGVGFSLSGTGGRSMDLNIVGAGWDGWLCYHIEGSGGECADFEDYYSTVTYSAAAGPGHGQGITTYGGPFGVFVGTTAAYNGMAGIDFLDFNTHTNVTEVVALRVLAHDNSLTPDNPAYDPNLYFDGASEGFVYGSTFYGGGGPHDNARSSVIFGSEHPTTKPADNLYLVNNLIYGTNWVAFGSGAVCYGSVSECPPDGNTAPSNQTNIVFVNNTMAAKSTFHFFMTFSLGYADPTTDNWIMRNNIFISDATSTDSYMDVSAPYLDSDNNLFYKRGNASTSTRIYQTNGGSADYSLAQFRTATGEDASSTYGDPLLVLDADDSTMDAHLGGGSPAFNTGITSPYTKPAWLPATISTDIGSCGVKGTTVAAGTLDTCATLDRGFHYDFAGLVSATCAPATLTQDVVTSLTCNFTMPSKVTALLYNWKVKLTLPAGFVLSSGSTSAMTSADISGTWSACSISGQTITCARAGDGNSEFPGAYSVVVSNVKNPHATGTTGTFSVETQNASGTKIADNTGVAGVSIASGTPAVCGNSIVESGESCDDGNTASLDGCSSTCQTETHTCGNSVVEYTEQCDDGNTANSDGCNSTCQIETPVCGNGIIESGETCDDGNTANGDGCSSVCAIVSTGQHLSCSKTSMAKGAVS